MQPTAYNWYQLYAKQHQHCQSLVLDKCSFHSRHKHIPVGMIFCTKLKKQIVTIQLP